MRLFVRRLRPAGPRRSSWPRVTVPTLLMPLIGLLVLIQTAPLNSPLSEREAPLAFAVSFPQRSANKSADHLSAGVTATAVAGIGPQLLGTTEFRLRAAGVLAGSVALGLVVRLGELLFSTRVGVIAAALMLSTASGRALLGAEFGVGPFLLLAMLIALAAIRSVARSKVSAIHAGIAGGAAIALVGSSAVWIPVMALAWLRRLRGLNRESASAVILTTLTTTAVLVLLSAWTLGMWATPILAPRAMLGMPHLEALGASAARELLDLTPAIPLIVLGVLNVPSSWLWRGSPRFLFLWIGLAVASFLLTGEEASLYLALVYVIAMTASWGFERAQRRAVALSLAAVVLIAFSLPYLTGPKAEDDVDRWAVRETGRFLRRTIEDEQTVGAPDEARRRLAYYGRRHIEPLAVAPAALDGLDYVVFDRASLESQASLPKGGPTPREVDFAGLRLRVIAEFGAWVLARVDEPARTARGDSEKPSSKPVVGRTSY